MLQEHRTTIRVSVDLECLIAYQGHEHAGQIIDLSLGGAAVIMQQSQYSDAFSTDTECAIRFDTRWGVIEAKCLIARVSGDSPPILGVVFREMSKMTETVFQNLVNDLIRNNLAQASSIASLGSLFASMTNQLTSPIGQNCLAISHIQDLTKSVQEDFDNQTLDEGQLGDFLKELNGNFNQIAENVEKIRSVILSFRSVSTDQAEHSIRSFKLPEYLHDVLRTLQTAADEHKITTVVECEDTFELRGFPGAFAQMICQLFNNACTHAFDKVNEGIITISLTKEGEVLTLRFADNGGGISDTVKNHIFSPHFSTHHEDGSTGLGLNIVLRIVQDVFGGEISCETTPGDGTAFIIKVPLIAPTAKATSAVSLLPQNFWAEFAGES